jgi:ribosomal protein S1
MARFRQIKGFLPVSQLAPEHYPRVSGGDKSKILDKLKKFVGQKMEVNVISLEEGDDKIIFSEKDVWAEKQKDVIAKYEVGTVIEGRVTAVTDFGVFVSFDEKMEGLIHISELAWQRIDDPADFYNVGDKIEAKVISVEGSKIFLSAKRLKKDPWEEAGEKYKVGQEVEGEVMKINPFGLFVKLDKSIHGLAHISQLGITKGEKIDDNFKVGEKYKFEITSLVPEEYRLGLRMFNKNKKTEEDKKEDKEKKETKKEDKDKEEIKKEESPEDSNGDDEKETKKEKTEK